MTVHLPMENQLKKNQGKIAIIVSQFNPKITEVLYQGAYQVLAEHKDYVTERIDVPGAFELPIVAKRLLQQDYLGAVALGAVIRGETPHFDYVCQATAHGIMQVNLDTNKPVTFGVITADNYQQAEARASRVDLESADKSLGLHTANKGVEAARALLDLLKYFYN